MCLHGGSRVSHCVCEALVCTLCWQHTCDRRYVTCAQDRWQQTAAQPALFQLTHGGRQWATGQLGGLQLRQLGNPVAQACLATATRLCRPFKHLPLQHLPLQRLLQQCLPLKQLPPLPRPLACLGCPPTF